MADFSASSRPLRVQVCLDHALDRDAYLARISLEPGFDAVQGPVGANVPDVRLASRCRMDLSTPEIETVVLVASPTSTRPCECCPAIARTVNWSALTQALRKVAGHEEVTRSGGGALSALTRRELEVLRLVGLGKTVNQCAETLGVTPSTIGNHKYRLMRKLGVTTSLQLLRIAVRHGLADLHGPTENGSTNHGPSEHAERCLPEQSHLEQRHLEQGRPEPGHADHGGPTPPARDLDHLGGGVADR
ncbi:response regulator transcription factor [Botrimarina mediterranea]|uniref:Response regulator UvrY n=1 Tax=Botrimarina mediterranea TaxID=2528022 RepID=A0A518K3F4_9BACT|nr:LuxR C-terminal-related transcriptional regulator [Botrimarina mediterranea]QDV72333.1 Response regulator UvrY [Botrimarina mediterranea]QDV76878.1 Response regulator UvrY [Planctomycetes bacterium K2D]